MFGLFQLLTHLLTEDFYITANDFHCSPGDGKLLSFLSNHSEESFRLYKYTKQIRTDPVCEECHTFTYVNNISESCQTET